MPLIVQIWMGGEEFAEEIGAGAGLVEDEDVFWGFRMGHAVISLASKGGTNSGVYVEAASSEAGLEGGMGSDNGTSVSTSLIYSYKSDMLTGLARNVSAPKAFSSGQRMER